MGTNTLTVDEEAEHVILITLKDGVLQAQYGSNEEEMPIDTILDMLYITYTNLEAERSGPSKETFIH